MASIDLPRPLQDYFAFAETNPTRHGRRFSITLPYIRPDGRLDRLQWWYHLSPAKEKALGDRAPDTMREDAVGRFSVHIERWLQNTRQDLFGDGAIPQVCSEGNRVVAAYRIDPATSDGMLQSSETADAVADQPGDAVVDDAANPVDDDMESVQGDHLPANKTAFG